MPGRGRMKDMLEERMDSTDRSVTFGFAVRKASSVSSFVLFESMTNAVRLGSLRPPRMMAKSICCIVSSNVRRTSWERPRRRVAETKHRMHDRIST